MLVSMEEDTIEQEEDIRTSFPQGFRLNGPLNPFSDVSANGANFMAFTNGTLGPWYGTSLASPLWASVITLVSFTTKALGNTLLTTTIRSTKKGQLQAKVLLGSSILCSIRILKF